MCLVENELLGFAEEVRAIEAVDTLVRCILDDYQTCLPRHRPAGMPAFGLGASEAERLGLHAGFATGQ